MDPSMNLQSRKLTGLKVQLALLFLIFSVVFSSSGFAFDPDSFVENSVLRDGEWYKFRVFETGIYKISYEDLVEIGFNNPSNIRIYGHGAKQLSFWNYSFRYDDLCEVPLYFSSGTTGSISSGQYILFFAQGPSSWEYNESDEIFTHHVHDYAEYGYYFLTTSKGKSSDINVIDESGLTQNNTVNSYDYLDFYESNTTNLKNSGRVWYGERFDASPFTKSFTVPDLEGSSQIKLTYKFVVRTGTNKRVIAGINESNFIDAVTPVSLKDEDGQYAWDYKLTKQVSSGSSTINFSLELENASTNDRAYIDFVRVQARRSLKITDNQMLFRDYQSVGNGNVTGFIISGANSNTIVWDITLLDSIAQVAGTFSDNAYRFIATTDDLREFVAFNPSSNFSTPELVNEEAGLGFIENQNLHGLEPIELVIVTNKLFLEEAENLAQFHREKDNLSVLVITPDKIYNEFSSGAPDISAIRNFLRMLYLRSTSSEKKLKYLLLFGDASYNNFPDREGNTNYILSYQSDESLYGTKSYISDDFYGLLDLNEGKVTGKIDIGIGRLPAGYNEDGENEALNMVNKIKEYYEASTMNNWRNQICFLGDDGEHGDMTQFMTGCDQMAQQVEANYPYFNFHKIYLDAYEQISSSTGPSYPQVSDELREVLNSGVLIFNYMGHGSSNQITEEKVLQKSDIETLKNGPYYPVYITATCQFSRFDDVEISNGTYTGITSAGEAAILNPDGGAIALLTTSRQVYQAYNLKLNENFYNVAFERDENGEKYRIGDIIRLTKNATDYTEEISLTNKRNFALLGDPAMKLADPEFRVLTDSINSKSVESDIDTLSAFNLVSVSGCVTYSDSIHMNDFNGTISLSVYDKADTTTTNGNDDIPTFDFKVQESILFRGKASVVNGRFNITFPVPKDISYSYGNGKFSFYAENGVIDAAGSFDEFIIGGTGELKADYAGPEIGLYMNDENFVDGGITDDSPTLYAKVYDENGINTTGSGIGHDIMANLDFDQEKYVLNNYFEAEIDDYRSGYISFQLEDMEEGEHTISLKVWDIYNNSSEEYLTFVVSNGDNFTVERLYNYPNPMRTETFFCYEHNQPDVEHKIRLDVMDLSGRIVFSNTRTLVEYGYVSTPIYWDGKINNSRLQPGVYPYRIVVEIPGSQTAIISEKLIIINY